MNCMKCGVEIPEGQVFCDHCLDLMKAYPIRPGAHIHLPKRATEVIDPKKPVKKRRTPSPEEQIAALKIKILRMRLAIVVLAFVVCVVSGFLALKIYNTHNTEPTTGRNYTIDTSMNN